MRKILLIAMAFVGGLVSAQGQQLTGTVMAEDGEGNLTPLQGASVHYSGTSTGTMAGEDGSFSLPHRGGKGWIVASFIGYAADSVAMPVPAGKKLEFVLRPDAMDAGTVVVRGIQQGTSFSRISTTKTENISSIGLMKMACCTLSESFENSATVTVGFTDAVSGSKQVQLLGLAGIYNQMLAENVPTMRGIASTFGWDFTPGPWLESIQISKGASSVVNGYESISGQMNLEFKKPEETEDLFINLFANDALRFEGNVTAATKVADNLWTGLLMHGSIEDKGHDDNDDGFLDMPKKKFVNLYNRWLYQNPHSGLESRTGLKFLYEDRTGGQADRPATGRMYTTDIANRNFTVENKTGFPVGSKTGQSLGIITAFTHHEQNSTLGLKEVSGTQNSLYANVLLNSYFGSTMHSYTAGASFSYDHHNLLYSDDSPLSLTPRTDLGREEAVPGLFAQYTYTPTEKLTLMAGVRGDYNSRHGWLVTPRANVRYAPAAFVVLRASAGRGFRSPEPLTDNIGALASSRALHIGNIADAGMDDAWNWGGNVSFYIPVWSGRDMVVSFDYFNTRFRRQTIVDTERDPNNVYYYQVLNGSYAEVWQADVSLTLVEGLDLFCAFRYNDTRITLTDGATEYRVEKPLTASYRGLMNLSYATRFRKWVFDLTAQVNGPSRLPSLTGYGAPTEHSPVYWMWFAQITKNTRRFDIYAGVENIFDYKQRNPIMGAADPFGAGFDSSRIWGPLTGRKIYAGIRLRIGN